MLLTLSAIALVFATFVIALSALLVFGLFDRRKSSNLRRFREEERDLAVFLFDNETLLDATPAGRQLLDTTPRRGTAWAHLASLLAPRFPHLSERIGDLAELGALELRSADGTSCLKAEWHDGVARITLEDCDPMEAAARRTDPHSLAALTQELAVLRESTETSPIPQWREDQNGTILWCNRAYLALADAVAGDDAIQPWPPARLFDVDRGSETPHRAALRIGADDAQHWFDVRATQINGDRLLTATPADELVKAEAARAEFVSTMTKTFADLSIGMVVFDRDRALKMFNPALLELTHLPVEFLVATPSLTAFLDRLREAQMMPEPKDYHSWRQQMSALEAAALNGTYEETWTLVSGQTYRVTGRPHPDGAVALLFEDISAEMSLTRRFRAELETGQSALDALPQAVAVFDAEGQLASSNTAYARLWGAAPKTVRGALATWQARAVPTPAWAEMQGEIERKDRRAQTGTWRTRIALNDGRNVLVRVTAIARGATLVDFTVAAQKTRPAIAPPMAARPQMSAAQGSPLLV